MLKFIIFFGVLITSANLSLAQKVKMKNEVVTIDGVEMFNFQKTKFMDEYYFYQLGTKTEVINIALNRNGTPENNDDDYTKIYFKNSNVVIESKSIWFGLNSAPVIEKLIQENVISIEGIVNEENLKLFYTKYNEVIQKM